MASGPSVAAARDMLDMVLTGGVEVHFWTVAPGFDGSGGTEVSFSQPTVTFSPAVAGSGGQIAKASNGAAFVAPEVPVASSDVVAVSVHDPATGDMRWLHTSPSFTVPWAAGESPMFDAGMFSVAIIPVS